MFWEPASHIWWHYRRTEWQPDAADEIRPMTVVRDDELGLVAWLAPETPIMRPMLADGGEIRSLPLDQRFRAPRSVRRDRWRGAGVLKIAPAGRQWSVWLFWSGSWQLHGWYVNLEAAHVRDGRHLFTRDHVLDLWVDPDRAVHWKDVDELAAAVDAGRFTPAEARAFEDTAREVQALVCRWAAPFCDGWEHWRPDPDWPVPDLP